MCKADCTGNGHDHFGSFVVIDHPTTTLLALFGIPNGRKREASSVGGELDARLEVQIPLLAVVHPYVRDAIPILSRIGDPVRWNTGCQDALGERTD